MSQNALTIPRLLVGSFSLAILIGTLILWLPMCSAHSDAPITFLDALFTSTSAICVTGLAVRDTGTDFTLFGQWMILLLIQLGGLGVLTMSTFLLIAGGRKIGLRERGVLEETHGMLPSVTPYKLLTEIFVFTFAVEAIGAAILTARFAQDFEFGRALFLGIFHSISAFCNAGFSPFSDSLMGYRDDLVVNFTVMGLIILGGIGFLVFADVVNLIQSIFREKRRARLSLHTRTVLVTTTWLIVGGIALLMLFEWRAPSGADSFWRSALRMLFLSVTSRTAGYNTVDMGLLTNATLLVVILLMIIGASPGSTGGGIKTTTFAVLVALVRSRTRNRPSVELMGRSVAPETVSKAIAATAGMLVTMVVAVLLLEYTESGYSPFQTAEVGFMAHLFEVVSALGTVGLSTGITSSLSGQGQLIITACMFLGRLGPLIVGASIVGLQATPPYKLPEERIIIG